MTESQQGHDTPSLYDRLGGVYNIATVVDDLIDRVMTDPRLNANPRVDEAHHRVSAARVQDFVVEMALPGRRRTAAATRAGRWTSPIAT